MRRRSTTVRMSTSLCAGTSKMDALERGDAEPLRLPASTEAEVREQLMEELAASRAHLQRVGAGYWERNWRTTHRGSGVYPDNHRGNAVHGYLDLLTASRRFPDHAG